MKNKPKEQSDQMTEQKKIAFTAIEQQEMELHTIGDDIWRFADTPGNEARSRDKIAIFLRKKGFRVEENYKGVEHSFIASYGDDGIAGAPHPNFGFLCVYDAEPDTGHSHGHNLVTVVSLAAALGVQTVIKFATHKMGKVTVIGCPGNKEKTAKIAMFNAGFFKGVDFLFAAYPSHYTNVNPTFVGASCFRVTYRGHEASDKDRPWETANPLNACVLSFQNMNALRENFKPNWTVKGVISNGGGEHPRSVPEMASGEFILKAPKPLEMKHLFEKLHDCYMAAAQTTGCKVEIKQTKEEFVCNIPCKVLSDLYRLNAKLNGFTFHNERSDVEDEDDISNVSTSIPTLKVLYYAGSPNADQVGTHEFSRFVGSKECQYMSLVQGKALAMMAVDLMTKPHLMGLIFDQHQNQLMQQSGSSTQC